MTYNEKLTKVTEAIHKACPDLLEVKRGCLVHYENLDGHSEIALLNSKESHERHVNNPKIDSFKILGQPIGIAEVLRAINEAIKDKKVEGMETDLEVEITSWGMFIGNVYNWEEEPVFWNLTKTLDQQEEPVIDLLFNILCT